MYEIDPTARAVLGELPPEDRANGIGILVMGAIAIFGIAWVAKELGPPLGRLAAQLPSAGAGLDKVAGTALLVAAAMAQATETHR